MAYNIESVLHVLQNGAERVTSKYGSRTIYINGAYNTNFHSGIDLIHRTTGTDYIVAAQRGIVTGCRDSISGYSETYASGNYVNLQHADGYVTEYKHMAKGSILVAPGQIVEKGQVIGHMGSTGWSTGNHLHFSIRINGSTTDPEPFLLGKKTIPAYGGDAASAADTGYEIDIRVGAPLYVSSTAFQPSGTLSGKRYWLWGRELINGRYRITNAPERVGVAGQVTGWVNESDVTLLKSGETIPSPTEPQPEETKDPHEACNEELKSLKVALESIREIVNQI